MITILNETTKDTERDKETSSAIVSYLPDDNLLAEQSLVTAIAHPNSTTQWLLSSKVPLHIPEVGLNPLADAAAYLFSFMGRLIHFKTHTHLEKLSLELVHEIENFQASMDSYSHNTAYIAEYAPIACYALCATLDDIICSTSWGGQGKWDQYSLVKAFIKEPPSQISFFVILERLIRDTDVYIDVIEFMYLCLSFGFKCRNQAGLSEFDHDQLEQITHSLYKRIRAYRGNFSKILSPFSLKPQRVVKPSFKKQTFALIALGLLSAAMLIWSGSTYFIDHIFSKEMQSSDNS